MKLLPFNILEDIIEWNEEFEDIRKNTIPGYKEKYERIQNRRRIVKIKREMEKRGWRVKNMSMVHFCHFFKFDY